MWSMPVLLIEWEKENDSQNQCDSMQCFIILHCHDLHHDFIVMAILLALCDIAF